MKTSPFNKIRTCILPKYYLYNREEPKLFPFKKDENGKFDSSSPDPAFWTRFHKILDALTAIGFQIDLILFHPYDKWGFTDWNLEEKKRYLDVVLSELSNRTNIWWCLANEYDVIPHMEENDWLEIEEYLAAKDSGKHLVTNHNWAKPYDFSHNSITHVCVQSSWVQLAEEYQRKYGKPVIYDEMGYEGTTEDGWGNLSGRELVHRFWAVYCQGGYASHGETFCNDEEVLWWSKGGKLKGESVERIQWLKEIIYSLPGPLTAHGIPFMDYDQIHTPENLAMIDQMPAEYRMFSLAMSKLTREELVLTRLAVNQYEGHVGEDIFLRYFGHTCPQKTTLHLPAAHQYTIKILDTWNMTCRTALENVSGDVSVALPGQEGIAVMAYRQ